MTRRREPSFETSSLSSEEIILPSPKKRGRLSVEAAIFRRRSQRRFRAEALTLAQVAQVLWAGQGVTEPTLGLRAAPSAGALYPLELLLVVGHEGVAGLQAGLYRYQPREHSLVRLSEGDLRYRLAEASLGEESLRQALVTILICARYQRTAWRYGECAERYVDFEVGHVAENIALQAVALGLGSVPIGAFFNEQVKVVLGLEDDLEPLYLLPLGLPRERS